MERLKREKEGLSILPDIYKYSFGSISDVTESDLFRMRWYGIFYRKKQNSFMIRIRTNSGKLSTEQGKLVSQLAQQYGDGTVAITSRMGLQIRQISLQHLPTILEALQRVGLETRQTGFDNVRNITNCPVAGIQKEEAFDATDLVQQLSSKIVGNTEFSNLPRKFNISITGCYEDCGHSRISDIGLTPHVHNGELGFHVQLGGAMGRFYTAVAMDLDVWLPIEQTIEFVLAVLTIFRDYGTRTDRKAARLHHLIVDLGMETFLNKINERLSKPLNKTDRVPPPSRHHDHIGIHSQKEEGYYYAGLLVPAGRMSGKQFSKLAELAQAYGRGELRLTPQQNIIVTHIPKRLLHSFKSEPLLQTFTYEPSPLMRGLVACTGKEGCDLAIVATKTPALQLIKDLENELEINRDELRLHWSGCPNSCAIVQTGDIGIHGTDLEMNGKFVDAVNIYYGGKIGQGAQMGSLVREKVPVTDLKETMINILTNCHYFHGITKKK